MLKEHQYHLRLKWTGNLGSGTSSYRGYDRSFTVQTNGKPEIQGSSDPAFCGDKSKYNPEELLVASLSSCHMLWFLHLCSREGIMVVNYNDNPKGTMVETEDGGGKFSEVVLYPVVEILQESFVDKLDAIHKEANKLCFIANSVNFPVKHQAEVIFSQSS